ncbi:DUF3786 domain-containing protein [Thiovibrio sp. JS02]
MTPFEILKKTPKTNCGQCGQPTCLAFAAAVAKSGEDLSKCPYVDREGIAIDTVKGPVLDALAEQRDLELIEHLKSKISHLDLNAIAARLGASLREDDDSLLSFRYLGQEVLLGKENLLLDNTPPSDHRDQILLYNYVHSQGGAKPSLDWIGLESLPNSISKVKTLATYCENRLAGLFAQTLPDRIRAACQGLDGEEEHGAPATLAFVIPVLPRIPQYLLFWAEEPEDGFAAKVKILFDRQVLTFLDLESLVFSAERMADRFTVLLA